MVRTGKCSALADYQIAVDNAKQKYADILGIEQEGYFNLSQELQDYLTGLSEMRTAQLEEEDRYQKALEEYSTANIRTLMNHWMRLVQSSKSTKKI